MKSMFLSCDHCGDEWITMVHKALLCFSNILLCDYCSAQTDKVSTTKLAKRFPSSRIMSAFQYGYAFFLKHIFF